MLFYMFLSTIFRFFFLFFFCLRFFLQKQTAKCIRLSRIGQHIYTIFTTKRHFPCSWFLFLVFFYSFASVLMPFYLFRCCLFAVSILLLLCDSYTTIRKLSSVFFLVFFMVPTYFFFFFLVVSLLSTATICRFACLRCLSALSFVVVVVVTVRLLFCPYNENVLLFKYLKLWRMKRYVLSVSVCLCLRVSYTNGNEWRR